MRAGEAQRIALEKASGASLSLAAQSKPTRDKPWAEIAADDFDLAPAVAKGAIRVNPDTRAKDCCGRLCREPSIECLLARRGQGSD